MTTTREPDSPRRTGPGTPLSRRAAPAVGLFVLAPLVGEFLLGNLRIDQLFVLPLFAPLYGGGALLIRETVRRTGRGWPAIVLLAAAYALLEEGPIDRLLWNPSYSGQVTLAGDAYLPALGTNVSILQAVLSLHTIWSISVPIALVESFVPHRRTAAWLGRTGLMVTGALFAFGVGIAYWAKQMESPFRATPGQYAGAVVVIVALVVAAFTLAHRPRPVDRMAPGPWLVGVLTLVLTSLLLVLVMFWPARLSQWVSVAAWCVVAAALIVLLARWSRSRGWGDPHRLGVAAGALLTYVWVAFPHRPGGVGPGTRTDVLDLVGNTVFALFAVALIMLAARVATSGEPSSCLSGPPCRRVSPRAILFLLLPPDDTVRCTARMILRSVLDAHHVHVRGDNPWQQRARLHQALWRERQSLPVGLHNGSPLGSRLDTSVAQPPELRNYLSPQAREQVRKAVADASRTRALLSRPRLWVDLLSSQPLCFNVFGPLAADLDLATATLRQIWPDIRAVRDIRFEWSPGHGNPVYTANRSAFDVFVEYDGDHGRSFLGIEVKYHEDLGGRPASDKGGFYVEIARDAAVFDETSVSRLTALPLQQIWLDHLLALRMLGRTDDGWDAGTFVLLYPVGNTQCSAAARDYRHCLTDGRTFDARTLDEVVQAARLATTSTWPHDVHARYLDPALVNSVIEEFPAGARPSPGVSGGR